MGAGVEAVARVVVKEAAAHQAVGAFRVEAARGAGAMAVGAPDGVVEAVASTAASAAMAVALAVSPAMCAHKHSL